MPVEGFSSVSLPYDLIKLIKKYIFKTKGDIKRGDLSNIILRAIIEYMEKLVKGDKELEKELNEIKGKFLKDTQGE